MSDTQIVTLARHDNIGLIRIDRPPVDAIDRSVRAGLVRSVEEVDADASHHAFFAERTTAREPGVLLQHLVAKGRSFSDGPLAQAA